MPTPDTSTPPPAPGGRKPGWLASIVALPNDSVKKTLFVAIATCLCCSVVVATAAVALRPLQQANRDAERVRDIVEVANLKAPDGDVLAAFRRIEARLIQLDDGSDSDAFDPLEYDFRKAAKDDALSHALPAVADPAGIKRRPDYMPVYLVRDDDGALLTVVLPVHGVGLWSTLYGFLALDGDLRSAQNLKFYQHGETPGLGGEVDNPKWRALWRGKLMFDEQWRPRVELVKGSVDASTPDAQYKIDGLAGSTLTSRGVENLINYWLGEQGYGPYLARLRNEKAETARERD